MKARKILAIVLTMAMVMSFTSIAAFAAAGDTADLTIAGVDVFGDLIDATDATNVADLGTMDEITVYVPLSSAQLAADASTLVVTADTDFKVTHYIAGASEATVVATVISDGDALATELAASTKFAYGDVLWFSDGVDQMLRVVFVTPESGTIGGDATKKSPVYNVTVPTTLAFAIDPLQIGTVENNGQISSGTFAFGNASNVPVKVSVALTAAEKTGVTFKGSDWVPSDKTTGATKDVKLALLGAVDTAGTPTLADPANGTLDYTQSDDADTLRWFGTSDRKASIEFLLAAGTGTALNATAADSVGIFQIFAQMETYAAWLAGDISLTGTYTLQGFKTGDYVAPFASGTGDDLATVGATETGAFEAWNGGIPAKGEEATRADATELVGLNVMPATASAWYLSSTSLTVAKPAVTTAGLKIPFDAQGGTVAFSNNASGSALDSTNVAYSSTNKEITVLQSRLDKITDTDFVIKAVVTGGDAPGTFLITVTP